MIHKLIDSIKSNYKLMIVSVFLAVLIWLFVTNISNPEVTDTVTCNIDVYYGEELSGAGKTYSLSAETVRVSYKVRSNFRRLVYPGNFKAYVDLRDYSVTGAVPIYVDVDENVSGYISDVRQNPMVVHVDTENMIEKAFDIGIETVGKPASGKIVGPVELSSDQLVLYGPENDIGRVARAALVINVDGTSTDLSGTGTISYFDSNNNEIKLDSKTVARNEINYNVAIYGTKTLFLNARVNGTPARGYAVNSIEVTPTSVEVYGKQEVLDMHTSINLPKELVDVSGAERNVAVSTNISGYMPEGVQLSGDGNVTIVAFIGYANDNNTAPTYSPTLAPSSAPASAPESSEPESSGTESSEPESGESENNGSGSGESETGESESSGSESRGPGGSASGSSESESDKSESRGPGIGPGGSGSGNSESESTGEPIETIETIIDEQSGGSGGTANVETYEAPFVIGTES